MASGTMFWNSRLPYPETGSRQAPEWGHLCPHFIDVGWGRGDWLPEPGVLSLGC